MPRLFTSGAIGFLFALLGLVDTASAQRAPLDFLGTYGDWDVRATPAGPAQICILRALHDGIADGDVFWTFAPDRADRFPDGYLALDPRFLPIGGQAAVVVDDHEGPWPLVQAVDGFTYSAAEDSSAIGEAFRRGQIAHIGITPAGEPITLVDLSLLGFSAAADAAMRACGMRRSFP